MPRRNRRATLHFLLEKWARSGFLPYIWSKMELLFQCMLPIVYCVLHVKISKDLPFSMFENSRWPVPSSTISHGAMGLWPPVSRPRCFLFSGRPLSKLSLELRQARVRIRDGQWEARRHHDESWPMAHSDCHSCHRLPLSWTNLGEAAGKSVRKATETPKHLNLVTSWGIPFLGKFIETPFQSFVRKVFRTLRPKPSSLLCLSRNENRITGEPLRHKECFDMFWCFDVVFCPPGQVLEPQLLPRARRDMVFSALQVFHEKNFFVFHIVSLFVFPVLFTKIVCFALHPPTRLWCEARPGSRGPWESLLKPGFWNERKKKAAKQKRRKWELRGTFGKSKAPNLEHLGHLGGLWMEFSWCPLGDWAIRGSELNPFVHHENKTVVELCLFFKSIMILL